MPEETFTITVEQARAYAGDTERIASHVESLLSHDGWKIFLGLFAEHKRRTRDKDDYQSLEDFRADRRAIKIVEDLFGELGEAVDDANEAQSTLKKLIEAEGQTPDTLKLDSERGENIEG